MSQKITYGMLTKAKQMNGDIGKDERKEIRRQIRQMRRKPNDEDSYIDIPNLASWDARLPNMHQLLISEEYTSVKYIQDVSKILESDDPLTLLNLWIDEKFPKTEAYVTNSKQMAKIVSAVSYHAKAILSHMLKNMAYVQQITKNSDHVDFFDKLVIMKGMKGWKLRLHIFNSDTLGEVQEGLHSHRNHFVSSCLYGKIKQSIWEPCDKDDYGAIEFNQYEYNPIINNEGKMFNLTKNGKIHMREVRIETTYQNQKYYMHPSIIHKVIEASGNCITLVLNSDNVMKKSCFCSEEMWYNEQYQRPKFTDIETMSVLKKAIELIP